MWMLLRALLAQWAVRQLVVRSFGSLILLLPLAALLKAIGWPLLVLLGVLAAPLLIVLFVAGLPVLLVILVGALLLAITGAVVSMGIIAIKIAVVVCVVVAVVRFFRRRRQP